MNKTRFPVVDEPMKKKVRNKNTGEVITLGEYMERNRGQEFDPLVSSRRRAIWTFRIDEDAA